MWFVAKRKQINSLPFTTNDWKNLNISDEDNMLNISAILM